MGLITEAVTAALLTDFWSGESSLSRAELFLTAEEKEMSDIFRILSAHRKCGQSLKAACGGVTMNQSFRDASHLHH